MATRSDITPELCRQLLRYEPETGNLFWRPRGFDRFPDDRSAKIWNTRFAGKEAFTAISRGYKIGTIDYVMVKAHRVAWAIHYGVWPEVIDHINGDPADNRIENLRSVQQSSNMLNIAKRTDNSSGATGVYAANGAWVAEIRLQGRKRYLGAFATIEDAISARKDAEKELGFHHNHGR